MNKDEIILSIRQKFRLMSPLLCERTRRLWCAVEASHLVCGGLAAVSEATKLSAKTIRNGIKELERLNNTPELSSLRFSHYGCMDNERTIRIIKNKHRLLSPFLSDEALRRWCGIEAHQLGSGGVTIIHKATGHSRATIAKLIEELGNTHESPQLRSHSPGGVDRDEIIRLIRERIQLETPLLMGRPLADETRAVSWYVFVASELGVDDASIIHEATGLTISAIKNEIKKLKKPKVKPKSPPTRIRSEGGGRKKKYPELPAVLENLIEPGDSKSPLRWTCKSTRQLSDELKQAGYDVSEATVRKQLHELDYCLQDNKKGKYPDRNGQFADINEQVKEFLEAGHPVVSVDAIKRGHETIFCNKWREWCDNRPPFLTNIPGFPDKKHAKAILDVVHNRGRLEGWANVGFATRAAGPIAASVSRWWGKMGRERFPNAKRILITVDTNVVSNGDGLEEWKSVLEERTRFMGLEVTVCHFPPGTSKWNKIEQHLFSLFPKESFFKTLYDVVTIVNFIGHPTSSDEQSVMPALYAFAF